MIHEFHLADFFTLANAACGMGAVLFSMIYMDSRSMDHADERRQKRNQRVWSN